MPAKKVTSGKVTGLSVPVYSASGMEAGVLELPKEIFGVKVNAALLAQAVRVYATNKKSHWSHTKTRGEVEGSTRKIFKQKHTGRARHGGVRAPIFVGGGIALGPKSRKTVLELPKKMKRLALVSALSEKVLGGEVLGIDNLDKLGGKTKQAAQFLKKVGKSSALLVAGVKNENALKSVRNIPAVNFMEVGQLNVYEVIAHQSLILTKDAVEKLQDRLMGAKNGNQDLKKEKI